MAKVKYNAGDSEAEEVEFRGYSFVDGKSTDVRDEDLIHFKQGNPYFEVSGEKAPEPAPQPEPTPVPAPAPQAPVADEDGPKGPFTTKDAGSGWWVILDKDGKQVGNKVRKDDAEEFAKMSAEDQAEYLK